MSQPMHPRAQAPHATPEVAARTTASPLLDDWSSLSPFALPTLAATAGEYSCSAWSRLVGVLTQRLQSARAA